jgi:L-threonylcarbamoyladenylate synthase
MRPIEKASQTLRQGGTVVFPTETVYGLGANAFDPKAVAKIFEIKARPWFNPLIVHLPHVDWLSELATEVPLEALRLAKHFWPGPLTLVLPKTQKVSLLVTGGLETVAVRVPSHPLAQELLEAAGFPIAAPSANRFTGLSPTRVEHAQAQLGDSVDFYLDGGPCSVGLESTIVGWQDGKATLLRRGGVPAEEIEALTGPLAAFDGHNDRPLAPGGLAKHYSPKTPLEFSQKPYVRDTSRRIGLLAFQPGAEPDEGFSATKYLSQEGSLCEAAGNLFQALHELEALGLDGILARPFPEKGLGRAINDRLKRAGHAQTACP